jgi:hypothetical protein
MINRIKCLGEIKKHQIPRKGPGPSTHEYHSLCSIKPLQYCDRIGNQIEKHPVDQQILENRPSGHASESPMPLTAQEEYQSVSNVAAQVDQVFKIQKYTYYNFTLAIFFLQNQI